MEIEKSITQDTNENQIETINENKEMETKICNGILCNGKELPITEFSLFQRKTKI